MPIKMKALKDFRGRPGEGNIRGGDNRTVEAGPEFNVESQKRADELEGRGFAVPVKAPAVKPGVSAKTKIAPTVENKAADAGPLASAGGVTGEEKPPSSSPPVQAPARRRSQRSGAKLDL